MVTTRKKQLRSNDRSVVEKNKRFILSEFDGTKRQKEDDFIAEVENAKDVYRTNEYGAMKELSDGGFGHMLYIDRANYLKKIGLCKLDPNKIETWTPKQLKDMNDLYDHVIARDGAKLYDELVAARKKEAQAKRKPARTGRSRIRSVATSDAKSRRDAARAKRAEAKAEKARAKAEQAGVHSKIQKEKGSMHGLSLALWRKRRR